MRVVGGSARGRRLVAPPGTSTRPTSDRVRESIFNVLTSLDAIEGSTVADLFAGTGALGVEALSRGAASCVFVERDRQALDAITANVATAGVGDRATVVRSDVDAWAAAAAPVDLALIDPPYAFEGWPRLLDVVDAGVVVLESDDEVAVGERFEVLRVKRYGSTVVTVARRASTAS